MEKLVPTVLILVGLAALGHTVKDKGMSLISSRHDPRVFEIPFGNELDRMIFVDGVPYQPSGSRKPYKITIVIPESRMEARVAITANQYHQTFFYRPDDGSIRVWLTADGKRHYKIAMPEPEESHKD